jgi:type VI secretion system protein ImpA
MDPPADARSHACYNNRPAAAGPPDHHVGRPNAMATPPTLDIASLLTPVSDAEPAGPELREAPDRSVAKVYFAVRDARKRAIDAERRLRDFASMTDDERQGHPGPPDPADWAGVRQLAVDALTQSKDLWVTAWLIEALTRLHGFAGLRDGVQLAHQLSDTFWEDVHPRPNKEQDLSTRFAQLAGLDGGSNSEGTLIAPVINLPVTDAATMDGLSLADYRDAIDLERRTPEIRQRRVDQGAITIEMFNQAVAETPVAFFQTLLEDLVGASQALVDFNVFLRGRAEAAKAAGGQGFVPPSSNIREVLDECLRLCRSSIEHASPSREAPDPGQGGTAAVSSVHSSGPSTGADADMRQLVGSNIETRQEAFKTLLRVSDYFRRTEPHSPVSYALEQVVRWGRMSLPELLSELIPDGSARDEVFKRAGIPPPPEK